MTNTITSNSGAEKDLKEDLNQAKKTTENVINKAQDNYESIIDAEMFLKNALIELPDHYLNLKKAVDTNDGPAVKNELGAIEGLSSIVSDITAKNPTAFVNLLNDNDFTQDAKVIPWLKLACKYPEFVAAYAAFHNQIDSASESFIGKVFSSIKSHLPTIFTSENDATFLNDVCTKANLVSNIYDANFSPIINGADSVIAFFNNPNQFYTPLSDLTSQEIRAPEPLISHLPVTEPGLTCTGQIGAVEGECN